MIFDPFTPFVASRFQVKFATQAWELQGAHALRRQVFCREQGLFAGDDIDAVDACAASFVALSSLAIVEDEVIGTVRIHQAAPGLWWGSRLAVLPDYRRLGAVGVALIGMAVGYAHGRGCTRFLANVQSQNTRLFQNHSWRVLDSLDIRGRPHHLMEADLGAYPPIPATHAGIMAMTRPAA